ncbi:hypothetical protein P152DRAFT_447261 [Eremomyces bilateralis CBS 781.70]|uniref:Uncharacterized protein n=1 Tax=Eremomyces bilateralis CBS 781.70 TaxID=1392243 RepID=A0A6G1GAL9_9PEZI|nr:uncharacterized protein P152DRAFT_447261 [Eremomyces bilateralis CBS 781.70]KAF1814986.1 hypothetical protein P152DRAFT_447261 [Eremomyces bilateralis CBS 781.70]
MSAASENRWRRPPPANLAAPQNPRQPSSGSSRDRSNTPSRDKQTGNLQSPGTNVWTRGASQKSSAPQSPGAASQSYASGKAAVSPADEKHVPVNGFNSAETKEFLKQCYTRAVGGADVRHWKPSDGSASAGKAAAWGSRPNAMASGQDFWVQLRKQIGNLESQVPKT